MSDTNAQIRHLLERKIGQEIKEATGPSRIAAVLFGCSLVPLIGLLATAFQLTTQQQTPWVGAVLVAGTTALTLTVWQIGAHYAKEARRHRQRARQLEDLELYVAMVPAESLPAKELLNVVIAGRNMYFGDVASNFCLSEDTEVKNAG